MKLNIIIFLAAFISSGSIRAMEQQSTSATICPHGFCCYQGAAEKTVHAMAAIESNRDEQLNGLAKKYCFFRYVMEPIRWTCCLPCMVYTCCTDAPTAIPMNNMPAANHINY